MRRTAGDQRVDSPQATGIDLTHREFLNMKLDYEWIMEHEPIVYRTIKNSIGQEIKLCEHPLEGDQAPVVAICHGLKLAAFTDFFDCEDMYEGSDYAPVFDRGELKCEFDLT